MLLESLAVQSFAAFFITLMVTLISAPVARRLGLVDSPNARKRHQGEIPVVGGIAIFLALALVGIFWGDINQTLITVNGNDALWVFMSCGAFLVITGALDDKFHLGVFMRVLSEVLVAVAVIEVLDLQVAYLGDLLGWGTIRLDPSLAYLFTVIAIFGIINVFWICSKNFYFFSMKAHCDIISHLTSHR